MKYFKNFNQNCTFINLFYLNLALNRQKKQRLLEEQQKQREEQQKQQEKQQKKRNRRKATKETSIQEIPYTEGYFYKNN